MAACEWQEAQGRIEVLGDHRLHPGGGRSYSLVKLRTDEGRLVTLEHLHAGARVTALLHPGDHVRLLAFSARGQIQAIAAANSEEGVDDIASINQGGRFVRTMRLGAVALAAAPFVGPIMGQSYGAPVIAILLWPLAALFWWRAGRFASSIPGEAEMRERLRQWASSAEVSASTP